MLRYSADLKDRARYLRKDLTDSERVLWSRLRNKQLLGVQFYRQKPIGDHIVDFYAPGVKWVIEVDGSQHMEGVHLQRDKRRDESMVDLDLKVLRFDSRVVLTETDAIVEAIFQIMTERLSRNPL